VSRAWLVVGLVGLATVAIKGAGPVLLGERPLPPRVLRLVRLLAPALLAALVLTQAVGSPDGLAVDARLAGLAAAVVALVLRAPPLLVVVVAAVAAALTRLAA
jgi:branched chain amino acid efflux pump